MLTNFKSYVGRLVTFKDGSKSKSKGVGVIVINELFILNDVLFVVDLKANLIGAGRLCDDELMEMYTKSTCKVMKNGDSCVLHGARSSDKCYSLEYEVMPYFKSFYESMVLMVGTPKLRDLAKLIKLDIVRGILKFIEKYEYVCGSC